MAKADLTAARLRELLNYDPETGAFTWIVAQRPGNGGPAQPGKIAGAIKEKKYRVIRIDNRLYRANRLAWLYTTGLWPAKFVDHINGDPLDNRITNLRDVDNRTNSQNQRRARVDSGTGMLGVSWDPSRKKWLSQIKAGNKALHIGRFTSAEEAHQAYLVAKRRLHEGCTI